MNGKPDAHPSWTLELVQEVQESDCLIVGTSATPHASLLKNNYKGHAGPFFLLPPTDSIKEGLLHSSSNPGAYLTCLGLLHQFPLLQTGKTSICFTEEL